MEHTTGTMLGHAIPGTWFFLWGLWWVIASGWNRRRGLASQFSYVISPLEPYLRIGAGVAGALGELYWGNWVLVDSSIVNFQHATMFLGFALSGLVELLAGRKRVPAYAGQVILILALLVEALLFHGHPNAAGLAQVVHRLLVWVILFTVLILVLELRWQTGSLTMVKAFALIVQGTWFWHVGYMLYVSDLDPTGHSSVMLAYLFFSWHLLLIPVVMYLVSSAVSGVRRGASAAT